MIDEEGKRHETPAPPAIPPHMVDGLTSAAQRKVFGNIADEGTSPKRAAKKSSARKASKRAAKKVAETPDHEE